MAITQVGATVSQGVGSGADVTLTLPSMAEGDVVILVGGTSNATSTAPPTVAGPSTTGYTQIILDHTDADTGTPSEDWCMFGAWYKVMGATPDGSVTGQGNANASNATVYHAIVLRGVDTGAVVDAVSSFSRPGGSGAPDPPAVTVATVGAWVFACGVYVHVDATATAPSGYTGLAWASGNDTNDISGGFAYKEATATGSEDPGAFSGLDAPIELNPGAFTFAIKPAGGGGATDLTAADSAHAHATESPTLTQAHILAPVDSAHGHTVEAATLTQVHVLSPADSAHAHAAESPTLTQAGDLEPADSDHAHGSESPALTQVHVLAPADSSHGHASESPTIATGTNLVPADSTHAHAADSPAVTQLHLLDPARTVHAHAADLAALTQAHELAALDSLHAHASDGPTLDSFEPASTTPAERTVTVATEARALDVPAESRAVTVPAESRTISPPNPA